MNDTQPIDEMINGMYSQIRFTADSLINFIIAMVVIFGVFAMIYFLTSTIKHTFDSEVQMVTTEKRPEPHRQTYLEYVKERLKIERMMK